MSLREASRLLLFFLVSALPVGPVFCDPGKATELNNQGVMAAREGRFEDALGLLRQAREEEPEDPEVRRNLSGVLTDWAQILIGRRESDAAVNALEEAAALDPDNGWAWLAWGDRLYLDQANLDQAVVLWRRAYAKVPSAWSRQILQRISQAERDLAIERNFKELQNERFLLRLEPGSNTAKAFEILSKLDEAHGRFAASMGPVSHRIQVIVYARGDFERLSGRRDLTVGMYDGRLRLRVDDADSPFFLAIIAHELAHAFLVELYGNGIPTWIHEGFAQTQESPPRDSFRSANDWVPLQWLDRRFKQPSNAQDLEKAYAQSFDAVEMLLARFGMVRFKQFLLLLSQGKEIEQAFDSAFAPLSWVKFSQGKLD